MNLRYGPLREIIETVILGLIVFLLAREAVQNFQVEGSSMRPTLGDLRVGPGQQDRLLGGRSGPFDALLPGRSNGDFLISGPDRGSVVISSRPTAPTTIS